VTALPEAIEVETAAAPDAAVIWLHGLGADGRDFEPVVPELRLPPSLRLRFVFPHAPVRPVTINMGMRMRAWYDILQLGGGREDEAGIRESQGLVEALIAREEQRGIPAARVALAGFSQGGAIVLQAALRHPRRLAGAIALSAIGCGEATRATTNGDAGTLDASTLASPDRARAEATCCDSVRSRSPTVTRSLTSPRSRHTTTSASSPTGAIETRLIR